MSRKVQWGWEWDFLTFIVNRNKSVISVQKNLSFKYRIKIKIQSALINFSFFITIHNVSVFIDSNSCTLETIQN